MMACPPFDAETLSAPMLEYCEFETWEQISVKSKHNSYIFTQQNAFENGGNFVWPIKPMFAIWLI